MLFMVPDVKLLIFKKPGTYQGIFLLLPLKKVFLNKIYFSYLKITNISQEKTKEGK